MRAVIDPSKKPRKVPDLGDTRNFGPTVAWYTKAIAYGLARFGSVRVICNTPGCPQGVGGQRIRNAAVRLGVAVRVRREYNDGERSVVGDVVGGRHEPANDAGAAPSSNQRGR